MINHFGQLHKMVPAARDALALAQPEPEGLTDEELEDVARTAEIRSMREQGGLTASDANGIAAQLQVQRLAGLRAVFAAGKARRPTPQPPADGDASTVIPWLLEMAVMAANSDSPYSAGMLTLAAQLIGEGVDEDAPSPPVDGEVADLVAALKVIDKMQNEWILLGNDDGTASPSLTMPISLRRFTVIRDALTRAAELLQCQQPQPVPVSERPPLSHECDEDGHLWLGVLETDALLGCPHFSLWSYDESRKRLGGSYTHFLPYNTPLLPAHALPMPASEEASNSGG